MESMDTLCERLVQIRRGSGMTQESVAARLGISRQALSKWETGEALPSTANLIALADIYRVSVDQLVGHQVPSGQVQNPVAAPEEVPDVQNTNTKSAKRIEPLVAAIISPVCAVIYCVISGVFDIWGWMWPIFLLIPVSIWIARVVDLRRE